jgi:hypothetical protein
LVEVIAANPSWRKSRPGYPAPIHWYDHESFNRRIAATIAHDQKLDRVRALREFIAEFRGCSRSDIQKEILDAVGGARMPLAEFFNEGHSFERVGELLETMRKLTKPVSAKELGILGKDHFESRFRESGVHPEFFTSAMSERATTSASSASTSRRVSATRFGR